MNSVVWQRRYQDSVICSNLDHHNNAVDFTENMSLLGCCNQPPWQPADILVGLPPGTRFMPTDVELIENYMDPEKAKLYPSTFHFLDVYKYNPSHLPDLYPRHACEKRWYFITPTERIYPNGRKVANRSACGGYWKASAAEEQIKNEQGDVIGKKKTLVFFALDKSDDQGTSSAAAAPAAGKKGKKRPTGVKTNWHMHEYLDARGDMNKLNDNVLFKIYLSNRGMNVEFSQTVAMPRKRNAAAMSSSSIPIPIPAQPQYGNARVTDFKVEAADMPEDYSNQTQTPAGIGIATTQFYQSSCYCETAVTGSRNVQNPKLFRSNSSVSTITTSDDEFQQLANAMETNKYSSDQYGYQDYDIQSHQLTAAETTSILFENKLPDSPCYTTSGDIHELQKFMVAYANANANPSASVSDMETNKYSSSRDWFGDDLLTFGDILDENIL